MRDLREALAPRRASRGPRSVGKSAPGKSGFDRYRKNTFGLRTNLANGLTVRGITPTGLGPSDQKRLISLTAEDSNLGGFVARHFHPNAYFNDNWGCPRHDILPFQAITTQPPAWSLLRLAGCWAVVINGVALSTKITSRILRLRMMPPKLWTLDIGR